jgi:inactivated superfamily I helicase
MSDRPTPETDTEWDRLQMLAGGGYNSKPNSVKLAFGMANLAVSLERQRDEARELARELRDALLAREELNQVGLLFADEALLRRVDETHRKALTKAKEVLP